MREAHGLYKSRSAQLPHRLTTSRTKTNDFLIMDKREEYSKFQIQNKKKIIV